MTTSTTPETPVLAVHDLVIGFGAANPVVDHVDLTVHAGEIVALVGESGSGKSLTARSVLGLLPDGAHARGSVILTGTQIVGAEPATLRSLRGTAAAMVFQEPQTALNPVQTIGTQLALALRAHGKLSRAEVRERSIELLRRVEIPDPEGRLDWYPHQLSGGQKQRVVIALALSGRPALLVADEPTTALDVTVQAEILALLRGLGRETGAGVLLITHNMGVVADVADRVAVMRSGRIVEQDDVFALFAAPTHHYTRDLLAAVPRLPVVPEPPRPVVEPAQSRESVLVLEGVSVVHPGRRGSPEFAALSDVHLHVAPGEVVGLVGESGSGKTTLGRTALGVVRPTRGRIVLDGIDLTAASRREVRLLRKGVALVHQDPGASLDPRRSVGQSVAEPLQVHRAASGALQRAAVGDLLESVRLPRSFAERRPSELSGGQRQRVALARALALAPRLLVADEPTSALDVSVQADVLDLFRDLREQYRFACLFISHDLAVVHAVADRVAVLRSGRVVETGPVAAVFGAPVDEYTRRLVGAVPVPDPVRRRGGIAVPAATSVEPASLTAAV